MNSAPKKLHIPVEHTTLSNGLRVVASPDRSAPFVTVGVYYQIGFRLEPRGRSGCIAVRRCVGRRHVQSSSARPLGAVRSWGSGSAVK